MKWFSEKKKYPKHGDRRVVKEFAILPIRLNNFIKVWLETYYEVQEFHHEEEPIMTGIDDHWRVIERRSNNPDKPIHL